MATTLAEFLEIDPLMLETVKQQIAPIGCTDQAIALYFHRCKKMGADPYGRHFYISKRNKKDGNNWVATFQIEATIDGLRSVAESTGKYDGQDAPVYAYDKDGQILSATVTVYRKDFSRGISATARFAEYVQTDKDGYILQMWRKMPHTMIAKCAEALALRKAFPQQLDGVYTADEMGPQDPEHQQQPAVAASPPTTVKNVTPATANGATKTALAPAPAQGAPPQAAKGAGPSPTPTERQATQAHDPNAPATAPQLRNIEALQKALEMSDDQLQQRISRNFDKGDTKVTKATLTIDQAARVQKRLTSALNKRAAKKAEAARAAASGTATALPPASKTA